MNLLLTYCYILDTHVQYNIYLLQEFSFLSPLHFSYGLSLSAFLLLSLKAMSQPYFLRKSSTFLFLFLPYNRWNLETFHDVRSLHQNFLSKSFQLLLLLSVYFFLRLLSLLFLIFFLCYFLAFFFALTSTARQAFSVAFSVHCILTIFLKQTMSSFSLAN